MASDIDKLKAQTGKKVVDIELGWDDVFEDYHIESITFEDGTVLSLYGKADCAWWILDEPTST